MTRTYLVLAAAIAALVVATPVTGAAGRPVQGIQAGHGLAGGGTADPTTGSVALAVDPTAVQSRVTGECAEGSSIRVVAGDGTVSCEPDDGATYEAGQGLTLDETTLAVAFAGSGTEATVARSDHEHDADYAARLVRTVVVSPVGTPEQNGSALRTALAGIRGASATTPYLLKIEPGVYDLGASTLMLKSWVDVEGSGKGATILTRTASAASATTVGVVATDLEVRDLTIRIEGGASASAAAVVAAGGRISFDGVRLEARGGTSSALALVVTNTPTVTVADSELDATGSTAPFRRALHVQGGTVEVRSSVLAGPTQTVLVHPGATVRVALSQLAGDAPSVSGTLTCAGVYDESFAFSANGCP